MTNCPADIIENQRQQFKGNIGFNLLNALFNRSRLLRDQNLYSIGSPVKNLPPIGIFLTDEMGLIAGILACLIVGLEFVGIPFSGYLRHNFFSIVSSLIDAVANQLGLTLVKPPTAGETEVWSEAAQKMEIPNGKSGNAFLRTFAGVFAALRDDAGILWVRAMVMMPYGRREDLFRITDGIMTSVMESDTVRIAYATRLWLQKLTAEPQAIGAVVYKGSQNDEDAFASALFTEVCERLGIKVSKPFASDFRKQERQTDGGKTTLGADVNELLAELPEDFWAGISIPEATLIECYLNDMGLVKQEQWINQRKRVIALGCDHLVDYSTDMTSFAMVNRIQFLQEAMDLSEDEAKAIMQEKGYPMGGGVGSGGSTLNCMNGKTLEETTAGTARDKWEEYLAGNDPAYNLTGMVKMVVAAARNLSDAQWLQSYLDHVLEVVKQVYTERPKARMFEAFHLIMERIQRPWLSAA